jgi:hypothetical protein
MLGLRPSKDLVVLLYVPTFRLFVLLSNFEFGISRGL